MTSGDVDRAVPFGRVLTAMVTPFTADGGLDLDGAARLAAYLVELGNDGLVVNGTTGEASTTTDEEKAEVVRAVAAAVGDRAVVVAGVGTAATEHTCELARQAEKAGAHGLLVVTPYYNRPPQEGLAAHFRAVADTTGLPVMLYDIPSRSGVAISTDTLVRLAEHPGVVAVKDAKGDLAATSAVLARSDIAVYCGSDELTLPLLAVGAVGVVSVTGHLVADRIAAMVAAYAAGETAAARDLHVALLPVTEGIFRTQAAMTTKVALQMLGLPAGPVRLPLVGLDDDQRAQLRRDLADGGVTLS